MKLKLFAPLFQHCQVLRTKTLEPVTEYQASREAWWDQMLMICWNRLPPPAFNIFQQNRTDVEAVCSGLKNSTISKWKVVGLA